MPERPRLIIACFLVYSLVTTVSPLAARAQDKGLYTTTAMATPQTQKCLECHASMNPNLCMSWERGKHATRGIGCYECHMASDTDPDALVDHHGFTISPLVTPKDCGRCHPAETASFLGSQHAKGGRVLHSLSNYWGEVVEGYAASLGGCQACHGSKIKVDPKTRKISADGYPNYGIGRINPDGSEGNCSACHQRHDFRLAAVRRSEVCGRCHIGPDHPQIEIWQESKHGNAFDEMNKGVDFDKPSLLLGQDPIAVPNCVTCHLGGTIASGSGSTHDPGARLSWNLRDAISVRRNDWRANRSRMQAVCRNCHSPAFVKSHFIQLDKAVALYNHKFALPAKEIIEAVRAAGKLDPSPVNEKLERDFWHLWHHQGRRARMGVAMMGADYVQWQGFYEVALLFYFEFLPEAERLLPGVTAAIMDRPEHRWLKKAIHTPEDIKKAIADGIAFWEEASPEPGPPATSSTPTPSSASASAPIPTATDSRQQ
ncbi:MAG: Multihem cytochrome c [Candidatus Ozemobacter sibiricus]|jgi:hypothetical protein|uniref:Multihem cytochrome c n=1 Tax=Candidatus Ozemobacter sibiricus TaxID=2268124 RepID=A0A367ZRT8_9BACT|nr:MAG: Multihem cytochrome c [Candidatus Ozemobacter sibiricus]